MADTAILLDVDGTLVDSAYLHAVAWTGALREHGIDMPTARAHRLIGMQAPRLLAELLGKERATLIGEQAELAHARRFKDVRGQVAPLPGARRFLDELHAREVPVVLTSSATDEEIEHYLRMLGAQHLVAGSTSADEVEHSKPDPEPVRAALDRSGCGHALVIGDSPWDVLSAKGAGLPAATVRTGGFATTELEDSGAAIVCEDMDELCARLDGLLALAGRSAIA